MRDRFNARTLRACAAMVLALALCLGSAVPARADFLGWLFGRNDSQESMAVTEAPTAPPAWTPEPTEVPTATPEPTATPIPTAALTDDGLVRVYLKSMGDPAQLDLNFAGVYAVESNPGFRFARGTQVSLTAAAGGIYLAVGGLTLNLGPSVTFTRHAAEEGAENGLYIAQSERPTLYCGDLTVTLSEGGLKPVLKLPVEDYLYGVVAYEMSDSFPIEALKAQAVAARTYAMQRKWNAGKRDYDLVDTTADQVYKGYDPAYTNVIAAVDATRGVVGIYDGGFAICYYTASNGGETALASQAWSTSENDGYLAVTEDPYDLENPRSLQNEIRFTPECEGSGALKDMLLEALQPVMMEKGVWPAEWRFDSIASITPVEPKEGSKKWFTKLSFDLMVTTRVQVITPQPTPTPSPEPTETPEPADIPEGSDNPEASGTPSPSETPDPDAAMLPWLADGEVDFDDEEFSDGDAAAEPTPDSVRQALEAEPQYMWVAMAEPITVTLDVYEQIKDGLGLGLNGGSYELISVETETNAAGEPTFFTLIMRRFGHGVGMSQRGAQWMAGHYDKQWTEILSFYYPGMSLERMAWPANKLTDLASLPAGVGTVRATPSPSPTPAPLPTPGEGEYVARVVLESAGSTLNVRETPSIRARVVDTLASGREVIVSGEPDAEGWVAVRTAEFSGYAKAEYLQRAF